MSFFRKHTEGFLTASAIILVGVMAWSFIWGMIYLSKSLDHVFSSSVAGTQTVNFNFAGAHGLNLKGLAAP